METLRSMGDPDLGRLLRGEYINLYRRIRSLEKDPRDTFVLGGIVSAAARLSVLVQEEARRGQQVVDVRFGATFACEVKNEAHRRS